MTVGNSNENKFDNPNAYEQFVGHLSREVAKEFVAWLEATPQQTWLDVGAGTGRLSVVVLEQTDPKSIVGIDPTEVFVAHANERVQDTRVQFAVGDAMTLDFEENTFDIAVSGLVLNFVPSPTSVVHIPWRVLFGLAVLLLPMYGIMLTKWKWCVTFGMQPLRLTPVRLSMILVGDLRYATQIN